MKRLATLGVFACAILVWNCFYGSVMQEPLAEVLQPTHLSGSTMNASVGVLGNPTMQTTQISANLTKPRSELSPAPSNVKVNATKSEACSHLAAHCVPNEDTNLFSSLKVWCLALYSLPDNWGPSCCTQPDGLVHKICHSGQTWYMSKIGANVCASGLPVCRSVAGQKTIRSVKLLSFLYWPTHLEVKGFIMLRHFLSLEKHKHLNVVSFCLVKA